MVVALEQPGVTGGVRQIGIPIKLARTPGDHTRLPGPALGEHTARVLAEAGYGPEEIAVLLEAGAVAGPANNADQGATFRA